MATTSASSTVVNDETQQQPQAGEGKRERSTIEFPYLALDVAIEIAKGVHEVGGSSCQWDQLGAKLNQSATGGAFRQRVMTAKTFGLVTYSQGTITLAKLGSQLCDPEKESAAKAEAFLTVPLYKAVYEQFKGTTLPPASGLETAMVGLGVSPKQKDKARQAFQRSATEAGFFAFGPNRLVLPAIKASKKADENNGAKNGESYGKEEKEKPDESPKRKQHPFIQGLLDKLPEAETEWPVEARKKWLQTAANIFDLMYSGNNDDAGELSISLKRDSAK